MKAATAAEPLANGGENTVIKHVGKDITNGGSMPQPITNGYTGQKPTPGETEVSVNGYENLSHLSDATNSECFHLDLDVSDEEEAVDSSASTIPLTSARSRTPEPPLGEAIAPSSLEASDSPVVDSSHVTSTTEGDAGNPVVEPNVTVILDSEGSASSPDCVEVIESEPIVDPQSSTNGSSDAATGSASVSEDSFSVTKETDSGVEDASSDNANAVLTADSADIVEVDDSGVEVDEVEEGGERPRTESEVGDEAVSESVDKELSKRPEIQVIDLDDSSSESSKAKNESGSRLSESDDVPSKLKVKTSCDSDGSTPRQPSGELVKVEENVDKEQTKSEAFICPLDKVKEDSKKTFGDSSEPLESREFKDNVVVENSDEIVNAFKAEDVDEEVDNLALGRVSASTVEDEVAPGEDASSGLPDESAERLTGEKSEDFVDSRLAEIADRVVDKEIADESALTSALTLLPSSDEGADKEIVEKDEVKAKPTFTGAEIVALTLDCLIVDVVNKSEGITEPVTDKDGQSAEDIKHPQEVAKIDDNDSESNSVPDLDKFDDKAIAQSKDVKDETPPSDSALPNGGSDKSERKGESVDDKTASDSNPLVGAGEKDDSKAPSEKGDSKSLLGATSKSNATNVTTAEDPPRRPKRSSVQKAEELAQAKKIKLNNGSETQASSVRSISKENLNPAQKRAAADPTKDDAKKARIESLRKPKKKKEMSNLDKAIARVATGTSSIRGQELADLLSQLSSRKLEQITGSQLEDLIAFMIGKYLLEQSDCAIYRKEVTQLRVEVEKWQTAAKYMSKQVKDLENVMKKMITDIKTLDKNALPIPAKVNRSVGLQVGDGRITNDQKKLAISRLPMPPPSQPAPGRRSGIMTNRPSMPVTATVTSATVPAPQRLRSPTSFTTPPKRVMPSNTPPPLGTAHRPNNVLLPSNSPPKPPVAGQTLVATGQVRRSVGPVAARTPPPPGALIDLTGGDDLPVPRQIVPAMAIRQVLPSKIRVLNPVNATPAIPATAVKAGSIRVVTPSSLTGPGSTSTRVAYMVPASTTGGESRMFFATTTAPKQQQLSMNGGTMVQRPAVTQPRQVVYSTGVTQLSPALRAAQPVPRATTYVAASRPAPGSVVRARAVHIERKVMQHPAALPPPPAQPAPSPGWKKSPPLPELKISKCDKRSRSGGDSGIILSWKMDALGADHDEIKSYQLFAYQEAAGEPSTSMWKKVGEVTAMALPMACTLTQFTEGNKYHFAVRAVDVRGRIGPFSKPGNILLSTPFGD